MVKPTQAEMSTRDEWVQKHIVGDEFPFSFIYGKRHSKDLLPAWERGFSQSTDESGATRYTARWTDPETGLEATCSAASHRDYPAIEWTLYLKNNGTASTPIIENIQGLDVYFERQPTPENKYVSNEKFILRAFRGDTYSCRAFEPLTFDIDMFRHARFAPPGGKPTAGTIPYFNLQIENRGAIIVIGWPGQWAASFGLPYFGHSPLSVAAGQEHTCLSLRPGEEIRSPLSLLMFYEGDFTRSQNIWRRFMNACNAPKYDGKLAKPLLASGGDGTGAFPNAENELKYLRECSKRERNQVGLWWIDAGWYTLPASKEWYDGSGNWEADKERFPNGMKPIADAAHEAGMRLILWFEPERVYKDTWLYNNHPEWLIMNDFPEYRHYVTDKNSHLLNLGDPEALGWLIGHMDKLINEIGFDNLRLDFCCDPLSYWRGADAADRQGMTENLYVQGFIKFLDAIRRLHPDMVIDSCAGGGTRFDLETARRSLLFTPSDYAPWSVPNDPYNWEGMQCMKHGMAHWHPVFASGSFGANNFDFLSMISPISMHGGHFAEFVDDKIEWLPQVRVWREAVDIFYGDFYPLTEYSYEKDVWMAWQFDRPEAGDGIVIAFRREKAEAPSMAFKLGGLDAEAEYCVADAFTQEETFIKGAELMDGGLRVELPSPRSATLIKYKTGAM